MINGGFILTKQEALIRSLSSVDLLRNAFLAVEINAYQQAHRGSVCSKDQIYENRLKAECVRRFASVPSDQEVTGDV